MSSPRSLERRGAPRGRGSRQPYLLCQPWIRLVYLLRVPSSTASSLLPGASPPPPPPPGLAAAELGLLLLPPPPSGLPAAAAACLAGSPRLAEEQGEEPAEVGRLLLRLLLLLPQLAAGAPAPAAATASPPPCATAFSMEPARRVRGSSGLGCTESSLLRQPPTSWEIPDSCAGRWGGRGGRARRDPRPPRPPSHGLLKPVGGEVAPALCVRRQRDPPRPRDALKPGLSI